LQDARKRTPSDLLGPSKDLLMTNQLASESVGQTRRRRGNPRPLRLRQQISLRAEDFTPQAEAARIKGLSMREFIRRASHNAALRTIRNAKKSA
jgi:hypothetical protein